MAVTQYTDTVPLTDAEMREEFQEFTRRLAVRAQSRTRLSELPDRMLTYTIAGLQLQVIGEAAAVFRVTAVDVRALLESSEP